MRIWAGFCLLALGTVLAGVPADDRPFVNAPGALGVTIDPAEGTIEAPASFNVAFPDEMIPTGEIDAAGARSPIDVWPPVEGEFTWRTQSRGEWRLTGRLIPGQEYRFRLREGLKDLSGRALDVDAWGAQFFTPPLRVFCGYDSRNQLSARPQVPLEFNYAMRIEGLAGQIWFQCRETRQRYPCEILLNRAEGEIGDKIVDVTDAKPPAEFRVRPLEPLPVGRTFDLIVDAPLDQTGSRTLEYPRTFPLGTTRPLGVQWVVAKNDPTGTPHVEIKFSVPLATDDPAADAVKIEPAVNGLRLVRDGEFLRVEGAFDTTKRYKVTVEPRLTGDRGYGLAGPSVWGATFRPKPSSLLFADVREFRQSSELGLRFVFKHCRTGEVNWRLVRVPPEKLSEVRAALDEPADALPAEWRQLAGGKFPAATGDTEEVRIVNWKPGNGSLNGPAVFEADTTGTDGRTIVNRALILFTNSVLTAKTAPGETTLRLASMTNGGPCAGVKLRAVTSDLTPIAEVTTDATGSVTFRDSDWMGASWVLAGGEVFSADPGPAFPSGNFGREIRPRWVGGVFTDRPLYRPGEEVHFKGMLREQRGSEMSVRDGADVTWEVVSEGGEVIASGAARSNASGGWNGAWTAPAEGRLGEFQVRAKVGGLDAGSVAAFRIEEYRNPPFSVVCEPQESAKPGVAAIKVTSRYFHGAPNIGSRVRWSAQWVSDHDGEFVNDDQGDGFDRVDRFSDGVKAPSFDAEVSGEGVLGADGTLMLTSEAPFRDPGNRARCRVIWQADVTGPDGQTITGGAEQVIVMNAVTLGVKNDEQLTFEVTASPRTVKDTLPELVRAELYLVQTKSVKERVAPDVYRFRNNDVFTRVAARDIPPKGSVTFDQKVPGRYVLTVSPLPGQSGIRVSTEAYLAAPGEAELPVRSDEALTVEAVDRVHPAIVGTSAKFRVLSAGSGVAWVTVETDRVLDQYTIPLAGSSSVIEVPVKAAYEPNATVSVYLLRPGRSDALPAEAFGYAPFEVERSDAALAVKVGTEKSDYQPGDEISGQVVVESGGRPVDGAELAVFVVDDSVLTLGHWVLPQLAAGFLSPNPFNVVTYAALTGFLEKFDEASLTQKGYTVGGGGKDEFGNVEFARKTFRPLILWEPGLRTDSSGVARFTCKAPDNLTRFRVIALGQTVRNQFGAGDSTFTISKDLLIEPALPRFVREGDEVELRAVARQRVQPEMEVGIVCKTSLGATTPEDLDVTAKKDTPVIARFRAKVPDGVTSATVGFSAKSAGHADGVEVKIPVLSPTIVVREAVAGEWKGPAFATGSGFGSGWKAGTYEAILSTSPLITRLMGLPAILDYPHGCLEQKSSRILVYTAMAKVRDAVPLSAGRDGNYRRVIEASLREFEESLLPDGFLPYWPHGSTASVFVTMQAAWAVQMAAQAGYGVPESLASNLPNALQAIVNRQTRETAPAALRAFALYVLSQAENSGDLSGVAGEMYLRRDGLGDEGRAFLALAMNRLGILPAEQKTLVGELSGASAEKGFDPVTFSSATRTKAVCALARMAVMPSAGEFPALPDTSASLSTQENLWLLLAIDAQKRATPVAALGKKVTPAPGAYSKDRTAAAWDSLELAQPVVISGLPRAGRYVLTASRSLAPDEQTAVSRGMSLARVTKNLTAPERTGTAEAPFHLGDEILVSYRIGCDKAQSFAALEDPLPAGLEVINPNLAMFGALYPAAGTADVPPAELSHADMRDSQTDLYFDALPAGMRSYGVLARVTSVGTFAWPSAQISPMYDARFYGRSAPSVCHVAE